MGGEIRGVPGPGKQAEGAGDTGGAGGMYRIDGTGRFGGVKLRVML